MFRIIVPALCLLAGTAYAKDLKVLTGAGMSADSGIPTFRDRDGFWRSFPVYSRSGLRPALVYPS